MNGDWHPDATLRPTLINIMVADDGHLTHVGMGFEVLSPKGNIIATRGWSWNVPPEHQGPLEDAIKALCADAVADEGLAGVTYLKHTDDGIAGK
jgi:hypothetical protein